MSALIRLAASLLLVALVVHSRSVKPSRNNADDDIVDIPLEERPTRPTVISERRPEASYSRRYSIERNLTYSSRTEPEDNDEKRIRDDLDRDTYLWVSHCRRLCSPLTNCWRFLHSHLEQGRISKSSPPAALLSSDESLERLRSRRRPYEAPVKEPRQAHPQDWKRTGMRLRRVPGGKAWLVHRRGAHEQFL